MFAKLAGESKVEFVCVVGVAVERGSCKPGWGGVCIIGGCVFEVSVEAWNWSVLVWEESLSDPSSSSSSLSVSSFSCFSSLTITSFFLGRPLPLPVFSFLGLGTFVFFPSCAELELHDGTEEELPSPSSSGW